MVPILILWHHSVTRLHWLVFVRGIGKTIGYVLLLADSSTQIPMLMGSAHLGWAWDFLQYGQSETLISIVVGNIWSIKNGTSPRITYQSSGYTYVLVPGLKYKYTEIGKAKSSCPRKQSVKNKHHLQYPNVYSQEMSFNKE